MMTVAEIIEELKEEFPQDYGIIINGDFNGCPWDELTFDVDDEGELVYIY